MSVPNDDLKVVIEHKRDLFGRIKGVGRNGAAPFTPSK